MPKLVLEESLYVQQMISTDDIFRCIFCSMQTVDTIDWMVHCHTLYLKHLWAFVKVKIVWLEFSNEYAFSIKIVFYLIAIDQTLMNWCLKQGLCSLPMPLVSNNAHKSHTKPPKHNQNPKITFKALKSHPKP